MSYYVSQMGPLAHLIGADCGEASVLMGARRCGTGYDITVDDLVRRGNNLDGWTTSRDLEALAKSLGLKAERTSTPVDVTLIDYGHLPKRHIRDEKFANANARNRGHWIFLVSLSPTEVVYHDPYWPGQEGAGRTMTRAEFNACFSGVSLRIGC